MPEADIRALIGDAAITNGAVTPDCNVTLWRGGGRTVLFDVGSGANFMPTAGALPDSLAEAGIDPSEITDVVFTHAHPDHLWGLLDDFDEPLFSEAAFHISEAEWAFWTDEGTVDAMPDERKSFAVGAQTRLAVLEDRINLFKAGAEILPGLEAVDTGGHTPGHTSFMIHGSGDPVMVIGDAISHPVISFARPDWPSGSDQDTEKGIATRVALIDRLAADKASIIGYHLPNPGRGRVERDGGAYRFVAD